MINIQRSIRLSITKLMADRSQCAKGAKTNPVYTIGVIMINERGISHTRFKQFLLFMEGSLEGDSPNGLLRRVGVFRSMVMGLHLPVSVMISKPLRSQSCFTSFHGTFLTRKDVISFSSTNKLSRPVSLNPQSSRDCSSEFSRIGKKSLAWTNLVVPTAAVMSTTSPLVVTQRMSGTCVSHTACPSIICSTFSEVVS